MLNSLKFRLTLVYVGIFALFLVAFTMAVYTFSNRRVWRDFDRNLDRDAMVCAEIVKEERREIELGKHTWQDWLDELKGLPEVMHASMVLYASDGRVMFQTPDLDRLPTRTFPGLPPPAGSYWT